MFVCVSSPAARRSLRRRVLGSVLGRLLHHGSGCFRSGSGGRDQSRQRGVSVKPGNPLLQGNLTSSGLGIWKSQAWLSIRTKGVIFLFLSQFRVLLRLTALCRPSLTCLRLYRTSSVWYYCHQLRGLLYVALEQLLSILDTVGTQRNAAVCCSHSLMAKVKHHLYKLKIIW